MTVTGRAEAITFHLKMPFVAEDTEYSQRFAQIADKKGDAKAKAEYKIYVDTLAAWSARHPERVTDEKDDEGDPITVTLEGDTPAEAVQKYFAERTASKDWLVATAVSAYRTSVYPDVDFQKHSE